MSEKPSEFRLYGRAKGRPLRPGHQALLQDLLPRLAPKGDEIIAHKGPVWLEIGFGGGEHLAWQAAQNPDVLCIGVEPFVNGVAKLLAEIEREGLKNIRVLHGDARPLLAGLPDNALSRLFVLHPDPWPKKKHHKRRIISKRLLGDAARVLKAGAEFRIASDIPDYIRWSLMQIERHNRQSFDFLWQAECRADWLERPEDWPQTRYEAKALREGRVPVYLSFLRQDFAGI